MALVLALPAYLVTNESFEPFEERITLDGQEARHSFYLTSPEPLFFEFEFTVRPVEQSDPIQERPAVVLSVNDTRFARIQPDRLYVTERAMPLAPVAIIRGGENRLHVAVDGSPASTVGVNMRIHNYYGINPRFPRVFVVSDAAVSHFFQQGLVPLHVLRFSAFYLLSLAVVWGIARIAQRYRGDGSVVLLVSPSFLLWCTLLYSVATPLHVWLSAGGLLTLVLAPSLASASALWIYPRRRTVARVAAATTVVVIVCESGLRLLNLVNPMPIFYTDSYSRFRGRPDSPYLDSRLNALGFNDVDHARVPPAHVRYRIAAIGDSVAFGVVPYAANYLTLLETELAPDGSVEVLNMGVPGTGPKDYLSILVAEGLPFNPDLVMAGFFIGNDFETAGRELYEHSYLATSLYFFWRLGTAGAPAGILVGAGSSSYADNEPTFAPERFLEIEVDRAWIYSPGDARLSSAVAGALGYLRQMRDVSAAAGAEFLVVLIPDEVQINGELADLVLRAYGVGQDGLDFPQPNRLMAEALTQEGIPFLDLLPAFEQEERDGRLYKPRDTHWNLAGNQLAAATMVPVLRDRIPRNADTR